MSSKLEKFMVAAAVTGAISFNAGDANATCNSCSTPTTPTVPSPVIVSPNQSQQQQQQQLTDVDVKAENEVKNTNTVNTTGGSSNNTYSSKYKGSAIAPTVISPGNSGHDCFRGKGGFSLSLGTYGASAGGGFGGGEEYDTTCPADKAAFILMEQNDTAAEKARNTLIGAEKSDAVKNAVQKLQSPEGTSLMNLFAVPVSGANETRPVVNNYITTEKTVQPQALKLGE